ncbi:hypothetical protein [Halobellus rarus]|uniref:Uncharacterized protein n=1 Tax=Halobellus rarus TaxID=1126237 RepID=A0ABD6CQJ2_9EURY|nr:hypothetical protein [Halobellus rarus]
MVALLSTSGITGVVIADPPRPGTENNGLSENESSTLWSRDSDSYISQREYRQRYGETRSAGQQVANGTDVTFKRPPDTAATWSRNDFRDLDAGASNISIHPPHAQLQNSTLIADAHATFFGVHPSTRGHLESGRTPLYIAPNGTVRGLVDYRVRLPDENASNTTATEWTVIEDEVTEVRLMSDTETVATSEGTQTPVIQYHLEESWETTLTLEADIRVRVKGTVVPDKGNSSDEEVTYRTDTLTVSDSIDVEVYDLTASPYYATYPNGDAGVAVYQSRPWQGYTLTADGDARVRGVWRFYTARNPNWDQLVRSTRTGDTTVKSDSRPVFVHAYPSHIGPRTEPVRDGPEIIRTWGTENPAPTETIPETVNIDIVNRSYMSTYGLAVRANEVDPEDIQINGIVRGETARIVEPADKSPRQLRASNLSVEVVDQNHSAATLRIELRDNRTNAPIGLNESRMYPLGVESRSGTITIADQQIETNESGVAMVTVDEPGIYTAQYQPGSWLGHEPAYVSDTATVRWHPLVTIDGWFALVFEVGWQLLPFFVMFYAGKRLLRMLGPEDIFGQKP